ncbi:hypothetical protein A9Q96_00215 [Rhodobacterales bacterium 52_120_T64]|nr:hypothetical protein A9Q96_00215 [Rhodobacterales bacterium 52_120_T64]
MKKSLIATVSALVIATQLGTPALANFKTRHLLEIDVLINSGEWVELRHYVQANPELLEGADALASQLTSFMEDTSGLLAFLRFDESMLPDLGQVDASAAIY